MPGKPGVGIGDRNGIFERDPSEMDQKSWVAFHSTITSSESTTMA